MVERSAIDACKDLHSLACRGCSGPTTFGSTAEVRRHGIEVRETTESLNHLWELMGMLQKVSLAV